MLRKIIKIAADAMLVLSVIVLLPFAWLMRDGLGPDSTTSSGIQALWRWFMTFYSGPILIGLIALAVVCHCTGRKQQPPAAGQ